MRVVDGDALKKAIELLCEDERTNMTAITYFALRELLDTMPTIEVELDKDWISVTDKMPKLGQRVMAFCRADILTFLRYDGEVWFEMSSRNEYLLGFVIHWQPLPKLPKEDSYG